MKLNSTQKEIVNQIFSITMSFQSALRAYIDSARKGNDPQFEEFFSLEGIKSNLERIKTILNDAKEVQANTSADSSTSSAQDSKTSKDSK